VVKANKEDSLHQIISEVREEFFSDLEPGEIPNSDISDISDSEIQADAKNDINAMQKE